MSLTITKPSDTIYPFAYSPIYDVDTSITEGATTENLRIRGTLYIDGEAKAIIQNPKGVTKFDFTKILDSYAGKFKAPFGSSDKHFSPISSMTSLISGSWINASANWSVFSSADETEVEADNPSGDGWVRSPSFALNKGDVMVFLADSGSDWTHMGDDHIFRISTSTTLGAGIVKDMDQQNPYNPPSGLQNYVRMMYFQAKQDYANLYIWIGGGTGSSYQFGLDSIRLLKVEPGADNQYNRPCVYYDVQFQAMYETVGTTYTPASDFEEVDTLLYVPSKIDSLENFTERISINSNYSDNLPLAKTIQRADIIKIFKYDGSNYCIRYLHISVIGNNHSIRHNPDGSGDSNGANFSHAGWFVLNMETSAFGTFESHISFRFDLFMSGGAWSPTFQIEAGTKCYDDPVVIDFKGKYGNETITLTGKKKRDSVVSKKFYKNQYGLSLPVQADQLQKWTIETDDQSEEYFEILAELYATTKEILMLFDEDNNFETEGCIPVSIGNRNTKLFDKNELINNAVIINFWPYDQ